MFDCSRFAVSLSLLRFTITSFDRSKSTLANFYRSTVVLGFCSLKIKPGNLFLFFVEFSGLHYCLFVKVQQLASQTVFVSPTSDFDRLSQVILFVNTF